MFTEPSGIVRDEVLHALRTHWSIEADSIEHAAVGFGWDTVAVGPRERDLWMVEPRDDADLAAYGGGSVDPSTVRLYREWWDPTEIALYVTDLRRHHADDADTRTALRELERYLSTEGPST